jgi:hypothetical protein
VIWVVVTNSNSRRRLSDPLPPAAALPLTEGENKANLPLVRGRRERSERGGRSHIILNLSDTPEGRGYSLSPLCG